MASLHTLRNTRLARIVPSLAVFALGCPNTTPGPVEITEVEAIQDPGEPILRLKIQGRGFGLDRVGFDLSQDRGASASATQLSVVIFDELETTELESTRVDVFSVSALDARFTLRSALKTGLYGVRIIYDREVRATKRNAFEIGRAQDGGVRDAAIRDAGLEDAQMNLDASTPDSGVAFVGAYASRYPLTIQSTSALPANTTIRIELPHAQMVVAGANPDGSDVAVYRGSTRLVHQWSDRAQRNSDNAAIIFRLDAPLPAGVSSDFWIYFGDPAAVDAASDSVFLFTERFDGSQHGAGWFDTWLLPCPDRVDTSSNGAWCALDENEAPTRKTLGSPNVPGIVSPPEPGTTYEVSAFVGGNLGQPNDMLYFAYSNLNENFVGAQTVPTASYVLFPPTTPIQFLEQDLTTRTETGWQFTSLPFTETRVRFTPPTAPSLHFRFVSSDDFQDISTLVRLDDITLRLAADPEVVTALGAQETR